MLNAVLMALDAPPVFMRTKALRALGQIVTSDFSMLFLQQFAASVCAISNTRPADVRRAVEGRLLILLQLTEMLPLIWLVDAR